MSLDFELKNFHVPGPISDLVNHTFEEGAWGVYPPLPASLRSGRAVVLSGRGSQSVLPGPAASPGNFINANFGDPPQT